MPIPEKHDSQTGSCILHQQIVRGRNFPHGDVTDGDNVHNGNVELYPRLSIYPDFQQ